MADSLEDILTSLLLSALRARPGLHKTLEGKSPEELRVHLERIVDHVVASLAAGTSTLLQSALMDRPPILFSLPDTLDPVVPIPDIVGPSGPVDIPSSSSEVHSSPGVDKSQMMTKGEEDGPAPSEQSEAVPEPSPVIRVEDSARMDGVEDLGEEDLIYLLGVGHASSEPGANTTPVRMGVRGIEEQHGSVALDFGDIRLFVCRMTEGRFSVSAAGQMLLGRQDSQRLQWMHEQVVNEVRQSGIYLPFEPGWCYRGRTALETAIRSRKDALLQHLGALLETTKWRVQVSVLDSRITELLGADEPPDRMAHYAVDPQRLSVAQGRSNTKSLERLLVRERKVAEGILGALREVAPVHEIESIVGMTAGSTKEWKSILSASFTVQQDDRSPFFRAIVDAQFRHQVFQPLVRLVGACEHFSLRS